MKVRDDGEVIAIEFFETGEHTWRESSFPTPLVTVDHADHSETGESIVTGIELIGSAAEELREAFGAKELRELRAREGLRGEQQGSE